MIRFLWERSLSKTICPAWPCSICKNGRLRLERNSLTHHETARSIHARDHEAWDPDWIEYTFTAWARCTNASCKQMYAIAGKGGVAPEIGPEGYEYVDYFTPLFCYPMPDMIDIPRGCPDAVRTELRRAFSLYWGHQAACASRIRVALELLMNGLKIEKKKKRGNKFYALTLHKRLEIFAFRNKTLETHIMALKWLGNTGSHNSEVSRKDLLDAFEILEHVLDEIIYKRSEKVRKLSEELTKKHRHK